MSVCLLVCLLLNWLFVDLSVCLSLSIYLSVYLPVTCLPVCLLNYLSVYVCLVVCLLLTCLSPYLSVNQYETISCLSIYLSTCCLLYIIIRLSVNLSLLYLSVCLSVAYLSVWLMSICLLATYFSIGSYNIQYTCFSSRLSFLSVNSYRCLSIISIHKFYTGSQMPPCSYACTEWVKSSETEEGWGSSTAKKKKKICVANNVTRFTLSMFSCHFQTFLDSLSPLTLTFWTDKNTWRKKK